MKELPKIYDFTNKEWCIKQYIDQMQRRCQNLFEWKNLPETIDHVWLEKLLQTEGSATLVYVKQDQIRQEPENMSRFIPEGWYIFSSGVGGVLDFNELGTFTVVANARLKEGLNLKIGEDCLVCYNDCNHIGLLPLHKKYATQLVENDLTLSIADVATRAISISVVGSDNEAKAFEAYMQKLKDGKLSALVGNLVMDSIKVQPYASSAHQMLTDLIEVKQYLMASWMIDLGMNSNFNMKRESIAAGEADLNDDSLMSLVEDMLHQRKIFCEQVNKLFGLDIDVDYGRMFKNNMIESEEIANDEIGTNEEEGSGEDLGASDTEGSGDVDTSGTVTDVETGDSDTTDDGGTDETEEDAGEGSGEGSEGSSEEDQDGEASGENEEEAGEGEQQSIVIEEVHGDVIIQQVPDIEDVFKKEEEVSDDEDNRDSGIEEE